MASDRDETIRTIRAELRRRSGKAWSVTGGRGTAYGWITITSPPARRQGPYGYMEDPDREELGRLLGLDGPAHHQGVDIPAGGDYRREYVARASGVTPTVHGSPYWD